MSMSPRLVLEIPEETIEAAQAAFPKGNVYMQMRDLLGSIYEDDQFVDLFAERGQPAERPWRLALVTVMQFAEGLSDRQAADAVRDRLSWKYALGLRLTDPGFDHTVLSEFRTRLVEHQAEERLFEVLVGQFVARGLLKARGRQRTDSTQVLAAVRTLNRLELVGQTLHSALNRVAEVAPDWLRARVTADWFERYGKRFDDYRLPKDKFERLVLAERIGRDGVYLFSQIWTDPTVAHLRTLPAVQALCRIWLQQFYIEDDWAYWRNEGRGLPSATLMISSPYDLEARFSTKRDTIHWVGYKVHLTESCDDQQPRLITHIETTSATLQDVEVVETIHRDLSAQGLLPHEHLLDMGYVSTDLMVESRTDYQVELVGEVRPDTSWQATANQGFDLTHFQVNWEQQHVICPQGQINASWKASQLPSGKQTVQVAFPKAVCQACPCRAQCTTNKVQGRQLTLPANQTTHETLVTARRFQQTEDFQKRYQARAGIEGTLSQAVNALDMRRTRYIGLKKTHLQHVLTATALNILRVVNWLIGTPLARTRVSPFQALALGS
jgi:transposase